MINYKLTIAYDGTNYAGWQRQTSHKLQATSRKLATIQEAIESALQKLFQKKIHLEGSGRTDAGVHATAQVAHFATEKDFEPDKLQKALNGILPKSIAIMGVEKTAADFHARFDAASKTYRYLIAYPKTKNAFGNSLAYWIRSPLNVPLMRKEAKGLLGKHDFKAFQASDRIPRASVTTIKKIGIMTTGTVPHLPFVKDVRWIMIDIEAKGFLRNMVRNVVGTLIEIGRGKIKRGELKNILKKKDRRLAGPCAPASGLYLVKVTYV